LILSIPGAESTAPKAVVQLNRSALGSLPLRGLAPKSDLKKQGQAVAAMDDDVETTRKLERLEDMPAIDMSMPDANEPGSTVGENLEVDEDDTEANKMDIDRAANGIDEEDELDPLDAFMSNVTAAVKKVNANDRLRLGTNEYSKPNLAQRLNDDQGGDEAENGSGRGEEDDLDTTELNPEDILALAAKKAKKKDVAAVDHSKIAYEPFRKEFYHPPPDVLEMTEEEADLLRLELDGIKIRGVDCPKPITKWSHCGLPASW
jgi:ATP-dependent RNA helicase DDX46/PRP5